MLLLATVHGNSATADKLKTARNIKLQGAVSGNANFDGSKDIVIETQEEFQETTINKSNANLSGTVKVTRYGKIIFLTMDFKILGEDTRYLVNELEINLPDWAKPSYSPNTAVILDRSFMATSISNGLIEAYVNTMIRFGNGRHLQIWGAISDTREQKGTISLTSCYILD